MCKMFNLCLPDAAAPVPPSCAWRLSGHIGWYLSESVWAVDQHAVPHTSECASAGRWRPTVATPDIPRIWEESQGGSCSLSPTFLRSSWVSLSEGSHYVMVTDWLYIGTLLKQNAFVFAFCMQLLLEIEDIRKKPMWVSAFRSESNILLLGCF